ncbi:hypothetical protein [Methylobacter sp. S3L5C]|uniref:hypothetical protein n=1 Tax=Methylobacter sp. S3L5C TaxID=2839024 RepID=UPI001FAD6880|nr:hypothetical protein [Methylobacter sp. S3L5C]UOA08863.1 hypothetical protein KKZ03_00630 [Methylobacter sp. S3L5C]
MNKNTYLGLALAACLGVVSAPLLAEFSSAPEYDEPIPTFNEHQEPSELQRQKAERNRPVITAPARMSVEPPAQTNDQIPTFNEHQEPSELQRQRAQ